MSSIKATMLANSLSKDHSRPPTAEYPSPTTCARAAAPRATARNQIADLESRNRVEAERLYPTLMSSSLNSHDKMRPVPGELAGNFVDTFDEFRTRYTRRKLLCVTPARNARGGGNSGGDPAWRGRSLDSQKETVSRRIRSGPFRTHARGLRMKT
jgi:hypothetical protein